MFVLEMNHQAVHRTQEQRADYPSITEVTEDSTEPLMLPVNDTITVPLHDSDGNNVYIMQNTNLLFTKDRRGNYSPLATEASLENGGSRPVFYNSNEVSITDTQRERLELILNSADLTNQFYELKSDVKKLRGISLDDKLFVTTMRGNTELNPHDEPVDILTVVKKVECSKWSLEYLVEGVRYYLSFYDLGGRKIEFKYLDENVSGREYADVNWWYVIVGGAFGVAGIIAGWMAGTAIKGNVKALEFFGTFEEMLNELQFAIDNGFIEGIVFAQNAIGKNLYDENGNTMLLGNEYWAKNDMSNGQVFNGFGEAVLGADAYPIRKVNVTVDGYDGFVYEDWQGNILRQRSDTDMTLVDEKGNAVRNPYVEAKRRGLEIARLHITTFYDDGSTNYTMHMPVLVQLDKVGSDWKINFYDLNGNLVPDEVIAPGQEGDDSLYPKPEGIVDGIINGIIDWWNSMFGGIDWQRVGIWILIVVLVIVSFPALVFILPYILRLIFNIINGVGDGVARLVGRDG
jgi:hypothetical protein